MHITFCKCIFKHKNTIILFLCYTIKHTSLCAKCSLSIKLGPKIIGMNKKLVTKNIHPDTTPSASGLKIQFYEHY